MIVVTIELRSAQGRDKDAVIGCMMICNEGVSFDGSIADYQAHVANRRAAPKMAADLTPFDPPLVRRLVDSATRTGDVKAFPRHSYSVWRLVSRCLRSCFPEEE